MIAAWLQQQDNVSVPSWMMLQTALRKIGENELATRLERIEEEQRGVERER